MLAWFNSKTQVIYYRFIISVKKTYNVTSYKALTYFASGQIPQNSNSFIALNEKKSEMLTLRNQSVIGLLLLVILGLLVF